MMRRLLTMLAASVFLMTVAGVAAAGPSEDEASAYSAYRRADYATALRLFRPLADQGRADAQYNLGLMYDNGTGVPQNYSEAVRWYRLAAAQGRADAQYNLGLMHRDGRGVPQNYLEAVRWYRLAADRGRADAQNNLALMYNQGTGVPQNNVLALMWLSVSVAQGYKVALENRELVAENMTPVQIAKAEKLARDWRPTTRVAQAETRATGARKTPPNFFDQFDAPDRNSAAAVPAWDDLPASDSATGYEGQDFVSLPSMPDAASTKAQWRFTVLTWMVRMERFFLIGVASVIPIWLILRLLKTPQGEVAAETGQGYPYSRLGKVRAALGFQRSETIRPEEIRRYQIVATILIVFVSALFAVHNTLDPVSYDRLQQLVNLEYHPVASFVGALTPTIILSPFGYWMFGRILRRCLAASNQPHEQAGKETANLEPSSIRQIFRSKFWAMGTLIMAAVSSTTEFIFDATKKAKKLTTIQKSSFAAAILATIFVFMSRYEIAPTNRTGVAIQLDRWTGTAEMCVVQADRTFKCGR